MYLAYGLLALLILGPLLLPGYILTLDMVFVPHAPWPQEVANTYIFEALLHVVGYIVPGDVLQKVNLLGFLFFAAVGMHKLVVYMRPAGGGSADTWQWAAYCAGLFYVVNPYVYGRFMGGQYLVLLGYMLLPFFARALLAFLEAPSFKKVLPVAGFALAISIVSIHTIGLAALLAIAAAAVFAWQKRRDKHYKMSALQYGAAGVGLVVTLSAYWLAPLVLGQGATASAITSFNQTDTAAFATDGGLLNVLMLKGFWAEAQGLFTPTDALLPLSGLMQLAIWALIAAGFVHAWRVARRAAVIFGAVTLAAAVCALGLPFAEHIPLWSGYREPHKFTALVALGFAVFVAFGAAAVFQKAARYKKTVLYAAAVLLVALPVLNTPTMARAFNGQLTPRQYPAGWYEIGQYLKKHDPGDDKTLFLPWHLYLRFGFTERIIANPADKFFESDVIVSDNPEFGGITSRSANPDKRALENDILPQAATGTALGSRLAPLGIKYVLLAKDTTDASEYGYLARQHDLEIVKDTPTLTLYRNKALGGE